MSQPEDPNRTREPRFENPEPVDHARTTRSHAGEAMNDTRAWPGFGLVALGLALMGITLVAAGYGFAGWAWIGGAACIVSIAVGVALILVERKRVKAAEGLQLRDQQGH